jgi:hypothetical protein
MFSVHSPTYSARFSSSYHHVRLVPHLCWHGVYSFLERQSLYVDCFLSGHLESVHALLSESRSCNMYMGSQFGHLSLLVNCHTQDEPTYYMPHTVLHLPMPLAHMTYTFPLSRLGYLNHRLVLLQDPSCWTICGVHQHLMLLIAV